MTVEAELRRIARHGRAPEDPAEVQERARDLIDSGDPDGALAELERSGLVVSQGPSEAGVEGALSRIRARRAIKGGPAE